MFYLIMQSHTEEGKSFMIELIKLHSAFVCLQFSDGVHISHWQTGKLLVALASFVCVLAQLDKVFFIHFENLCCRTVSFSVLMRCAVSST